MSKFWYVDYGYCRVVDEYIDGWARYIDIRACDIVEAETRGKAKAKYLKQMPDALIEYTDRVFVREIVPEKEFYDGEYYDAVPDDVLDAADEFWGIIHDWREHQRDVQLRNGDGGRCHRPTT